MRRAVLGSLLGSAAVAVVGTIGMACGIDVLGTMPSGPDGTSMPTVDASLPPAPALDGASAPDDGVEASTLPTTDDGGSFEVPIADAGVDAPGDCGSPVIADLFNTTAFAPMWTKYGTAAPAMSSGNGYVSLTPVNVMSKVGALFAKPTVKASSFVATFRYYAEVNQNADQIGDGFTFMWVTQGNLDGAGATQVSGAGLGVAKTIGGGAFALDAFENSSIGDTQAPYFAVLKMNPANAPATYDWHVKSTVAYSGLFNVWRTAKIILDDGKLSANVDGAQLFTQQAVASAPIIAIGFTAATGGVTGVGFDVDTVNIEFTDAVCP